MRTIELCRDGDLSIRLLHNDPRDRAGLAAWRAEPHVHEWWDPDEPAPSLGEVTAEYGNLTEPGSLTTPCMIELDGRAIGYVQFYRWASYPDEVVAMELPVGEHSFGLDMLIGEPDLVGSGLGARAVAMLCHHLVRDRGADEVLLTTELTNARAQRAYEKAGFQKVKQVWELDTRDGQRTRSWAMLWTPATRRPDRPGA